MKCDTQKYVTVRRRTFKHLLDWTSFSKKTKKILTVQEQHHLVDGLYIQANHISCAGYIV